jgi:hypothetical protein
MSVRTFSAIAGVVSLGMLTAACSVAARPTEPSSSPGQSTSSSQSTSPSQTAEPPELTTSVPGLSWLRVSPEQGAPGSAVSLDVACSDDLGAVHSPALDIGALKGNPDGHQPWHRSGTATVRSDAAPGRYQIAATCGADVLSAVVTVVPPARPR